MTPQEKLALDQWLARHVYKIGAPHLLIHAYPNYSTNPDHVSDLLENCALHTDHIYLYPPCGAENPNWQITCNRTDLIRAPTLPEAVALFTQKLFQSAANTGYEPPAPTPESTEPAPPPISNFKSEISNTSDPRPFLTIEIQHVHPNDSIRVACLLRHASERIDALQEHITSLNQRLFDLESQKED